jgi:hypothetical protein
MPDPGSLLRIAVLVAASLAAAACRDSGSDGDRFALDGKLVVFNYRVATATFLVNLKPVGPVEDGQVAIASFEDPAGAAPIEVRQKIWPAMVKTTVTTPPLRCIVKGRPYGITIRIEDAQGRQVQAIQTSITSSQDQTELPDRPLVVGPLYTPNPELAGHADGKLPDVEKPSCPGNAGGKAD